MCTAEISLLVFIFIFTLSSADISLNVFSLTFRLPKLISAGSPQEKRKSLSLSGSRVPDLFTKLIFEFPFVLYHPFFQFNISFYFCNRMFLIFRTQTQPDPRENSSSLHNQSRKIFCMTRGRDLESAQCLIKYL